MNKWGVLLLVAGVAAAATVGLWLTTSAHRESAESNSVPAAVQPVPGTRVESSGVQLFSNAPARSTDAAHTGISLEIQRECHEVFAIANATERKAAFDKLLARTTDTAGIKGILTVLNEMFKSGRRFDDEWDSFWHVIAHRDPKATMTLIESYGMRESWYSGAVRRALHEWGNLDPQAAMVWLEANQSLTGRALDEATLNLIHGYAARDLKAATDYAVRVFQPKDSAFGYVAQTLTKNAVQQGGVKGLLAWFDALPANQAKEQIFQSVGSRLGEVDQAKKRAWLEAEAEKPYRNDQTYREFVGAMAEDDPHAAMEYAFKLPRSPHTREPVGVGYAAYSWLVKDSAGFAGYYQSLPPGETRDAVVNAIRQGLGDPNLPMKKRVPAQQFLDALK